MIAFDLGHDAAAVMLLASARIAGEANTVADTDPRWKAAELRETLRGRIGRDEYDRIWNRVAAMSTEQIVAEGLAEMRRVRAELATERES